MSELERLAYSAEGNAEVEEERFRAPVSRLEVRSWPPCDAGTLHPDALRALSNDTLGSSSGAAVVWAGLSVLVPAVQRPEPWVVDRPAEVDQIVAALRRSACSGLCNARLKRQLRRTGLG